MTDYEMLLTGLVGEHEDLYKTSATFHNQIDTLVQMLQSWVRGMAEDAEDLDAKMKTALALLEAGVVQTGGVRAWAEKQGIDIDKLKSGGHVI